MRHHRSALLALFLSLPLASASWACINDRDSDALVVQNKRLPDVIRVISGRFERNPPRYFQMRIARVEKELKANPRQFGLYDDLAVSHDRLGDDTTAMRIMAQKLVLLPAYDAKDKANKEAWYRYYANDGTFRAHRFLHEGAKVSRISELKQARDEIRHAIQIKPNAHFGREKYQLQVMEWIIATKTYRTSDSLAEFLEKRMGWEYDYGLSPTSTKRQDGAEALSGLIVLGAAWQSSDVFDALKGALQSRSTIALSHLARLRRDELISGSATSLSGRGFFDDSFMERTEYGLNDKNAKTLDDLYPRLRAEGDEWIRQRDRWMEAKFAQGQHPDTHPQFWQGWEEPPATNLEQVKWWNQRFNRFEDSTPLAQRLWPLAPIFISLGLSLWALKRKWRARRKTSLA